MSRRLRAVPDRRPRRRIVVELPAEEADELEAAIAAQPVEVSRSALVRAALRRGLRTLSHAGPGLSIRCD